eukprot:2637047-Amphidinium_carterae.2
MSRGWVHAFLLGAGLKCRSTRATDGRAEITPARIQHVQDHLHMKLAWFCREKGVGFANVYNIDESM